MKIYKHLPNFITLLNLSAGFCGIIASLQGYWHLAFYLLLLAAVFDFFDGFAARMLKAYSEIGKQLDSLADMVSFGVLPGAIMFQLLENAYDHPNMRLGIIFASSAVAFLIPAFSALRLAKFNIDTRQTDSFIGLPTPANAMVIASISMILHQLCHCSPVHHVLGSWISLSIITLVMSLLLVAEIPLFAMKFKHFRVKGNEIRYIFILGIIVILLVFIYWLPASIPFIILWYVVLSIIKNVFLKSKNL